MTGNGTLATLWALGGVGALFLFAIVRLGARGVSALRAGLTPAEWLGFGVLLTFFVLVEGDRALRGRWVPRLVARAATLRDGAPLHHRIFAPFYGMSLLGAPSRTLWRAWGGTAAVVLAIVLVRALPSPWRGIVDASVAAALAWGLVAIVRQAPAALHEGDGKVAPPVAAREERQGA